MRRFARTYLTIAVGLIVLANLILAVLYSRQFSLRAVEVGSVLSTSLPSQSLLADFILTNIFLVGLLSLIWFLLTKIARVHSD